jgi:ABC-type sugar transport system permease subunit
MYDAALDFKNPFPEGSPFASTGAILTAIAEGPSLAMFSVIVTSIWRDAGYFMIIFLAGLRTIDRTYYEAAAIDGAGPWRRFWTITFPLLSPVTFFVLIIAMVGAFKVFVPILVMTPGGGPSNTTSTLVYFLYEEGFQSWRLGYASAVAYILFLIILGITLLQNRFVGRKVYYQG